jgi:hypothetical protein
MNNPLPIITRLVGVSYDGRQRVVAGLNFGEELSLVRQPDNPFDRNAILAENKHGQQIGYLNRELAKVIACRFDEHGLPVPARVDAVLKSYYGGFTGVRVRFFLPDPTAAPQGDRSNEVIPANDFDQPVMDRIKLASADGTVREVGIDAIAPCKLKEFVLATCYRVKVVLQKSGLSRELVCKLAAAGMVFRIAQS